MPGSLEEVEGDMTDGGDREGRVVFSDAAGIFPEAHVERPVECIFDSPMAARIVKDAPRVRRIIAQVIAHIGGGFVPSYARSGEAHDAA